MTLKNRINHRELFSLAGNSEARDELLLRKFGNGLRGLTQERLDEIRRHRGNLYERAHFGSQVLFESLLKFVIPLADVHAQFTLENLAALVYEEWNNTAWHIENLRQAMRGKHRLELKSRKTQFNFQDLSYPQLFREKISLSGLSLYQGNLYEARSFWRNFRPSNEDFLNNVSLPLKIGHIESILLGIYWADGYLRKGSDSLTMRLQGEQSDLDSGIFKDIYKGVVTPLLNNIHNYSPISRGDYIRERKTRSGTRERYPSFEINSAAICTWLRDDFGYPSPQRTKEVYELKRIPFGHLKEVEAKQGFFAGLVAGLGIVNEDGTLLFEHKDRKFMEDAAKLSRMIGYNPSTMDYRYGRISGSRNKIWYFTLSMDDIARMAATDLETSLPHTGLLFNPKHYRQLLFQLIP